MTRSRLTTTRRLVGALLTIGFVTSGLTACQQEDESTLIALILASNQADRWLNADEPTFRKQVNRTCKGCEYVTYNADGDFETQAEQFQQALDDGADAIVLNAVDSEQAEALVEAAGSVPVIAYDRFVPGADYYVSYDATVTGQLQANATVAALEGKGAILVVNGAQTDANGVAIKQARDEVFAATRLRDPGRVGSAHLVRRGSRGLGDPAIEATPHQADRRHRCRERRPGRGHRERLDRGRRKATAVALPHRAGCRTDRFATDRSR